MSSGPAEQTSLPTSNRLSMLLVASTWAPWLADDVPDLSLENMVPVADGADGRLLPRRKSDQPILSDVPSGRGRWSTRDAARRPVAGENVDDDDDDDGRLEMRPVRGDHCVTSLTPNLTRGMLQQKHKRAQRYYYRDGVSSSNNSSRARGVRVRRNDIAKRTVLTFKSLYCARLVCFCRQMRICVTTKH